MTSCWSMVGRHRWIIWGRMLYMEVVVEICHKSTVAKEEGEEKIGTGFLLCLCR